MNKSGLYIALLLILALPGCKKRDYSSDRQQMILFQYDYRSSSQHYGYYVDSEGNVYTYNDPSEWNMPDNDLEISQELISDNTGNTVYSGIKISEDELSRYAKVIDFIASSKVTAPGKNMNNDGTVQYICYRFDENYQKYKGCLIRSEGRITRENLNFHAKRVSQWMDEIAGKALTP